jgi:DNA-directed RNA polymerase specialized sigma24 family protein
VPIVLAYFGEWSYEEIGAHIGASANHVGVLLLRARRALRRALEDAAETRS